MWLSSLSLHLLYCIVMWSLISFTVSVTIIAPLVLLPTTGSSLISLWSHFSFWSELPVLSIQFQPKYIVTQWSSVESWTLKLAPTWYAKLEHKPRNHPEERALVVETILNESIEPVNAQGCQRPSNLAANFQVVPDIKCTSMTIGVSLTSVTNSAVNSWGAGRSWAAARRQPGRRSSRDDIVLSAEMLLPWTKCKGLQPLFGERGASKCLVKMKTLLQFWHLRLLEYFP